MDPTGLDLMHSLSARKKSERFFFWREAFEQKTKNRTKINRALFFVPLGASGSDISYIEYKTNYLHAIDFTHLALLFVALRSMGNPGLRQPSSG